MAWKQQIDDVATVLSREAKGRLVSDMIAHPEIQFHNNLKIQTQVKQSLAVSQVDFLLLECFH